MLSKSFGSILHSGFKSRFFALAAVVALMVSCQTSSPSDEKRDLNFAVKLPQISDAYKYPQMATWQYGTDSGSASLSGSGGATMANFTLPVKPKVAGVVWVDLWRGGVRYVRLSYSVAASGELVYQKPWPDEIAIEILRLLSDRPDSLRFDSLFAQALVDGSPLVDSLHFPSRFPYGLDTADVLNQAMKIAVAKGVSLAALKKSWSIQLDDSVIHLRIEGLVKLKVISDTNTIFPPPPVRVGKAMSIDSLLVTGGERGAVKGGFVATYQISGNSVQIFQDGRDVTGAFDVFNTISTLGKPKEIVLDGNLSIAARASTPVGVYVLRVTVGDDSGFTASASIGFQVRSPGDNSGPVLTIRHPNAGDVLENSQATVDVRIAAVDSSGVDSVWASGILGVQDGDSWIVTGVPVPVTSAGHDIVVRAVDGKGNPSSISVRIGRKGPTDPAGPIKEILQPQRNDSLPFDSTAVTVRWKLIDRRAAIDSVYLGGVLGTKESDSIWIRRVPLPKVGEPTTITLRAVNAKKDEITDFVQVTRRNDTSKPVLVRGAGTMNRGIPFDSNFAIVSWKVTDNSSFVVRVGDSVVVGENGTYKKTVVLTGGVTVIRIVATDSSGNASTDSVVITRSGNDSIKPVITRDAGAADRAVTYDSATTRLSWKVTDNLLVTEVKVNGTLVTGSANLYIYTATSLRVGANGFKIVAKDSSGNLVSDSVTIIREWKDTLAPVITRSTGIGPKTVLFEDSTYTPSWNVADTLLQEVTIQTNVVAGASGVYSSPIPLVLGRNLIAIVAKDQAGQSAQDTFSVVRSLGTIPDLTISHAAGTHDSTLHVTIASSIADASIRYTVDGSDPGISATALTYSTAVLIDQTRTLKAVATAANRTASNVASRAYTLVLPAPVPSLPAGTSSDTAFSVDLSCRVNGATIYYTLDGSTPTANSIRYYTSGTNNANLIDSIRTLKAIAIKAGWTSSPVAGWTYKANVPVKVYTSYTTTAVIRADGSLWTTGYAGGLMDASAGGRAEFAKVMDSVKEVTESHILKMNGDLYAYGNNDSGQFGNGSTISSNAPVFIRSGIKKVDDGRYYSLILDNSNNLHAAGANTEGEFCNETFDNSTTYTLVRSGISDMAAGFLATQYGNQMWTLFTTTSGDAFTCGSGPLGNGTSNQSRVSTAKLVGSGYSAAYTIDGGSRYSGGSFLIKSTGDAYSTGYNVTAYLIPLSYPSSADTNFVLVRSNVKRIAGGQEAILMLESNGTVWGAGNNLSGSMGDGTTEFIDQPKAIMTDVKFVAASGYNSFFIKKNGALWAAGSNDGLFGDGTTDQMLSPVRIKLQ